MLRRILCLCLPLFALFTLTKADYTMDDTNSSIVYTPSQGNGSWELTSSLHAWTFYLFNNSVANIDYNMILNQTLHFSYRNSSSENCQVLIPFTGSGITIHAIQIDAAIDYTVNLDGIQQPPPETQFPTVQDGPDLTFNYNAIIYDNQSLPFGFHNLVIENTGALLLFDYADVNETEPTSASTTSATSTTASSTSSASSSSTSSLPSSTNTSHKSSHAGAIAGGVAGGFVALGVIGLVIAMFLSRQRRNQQAPSSEYGVHNSQPVDVPPQSPLSPSMTQEIRHSSYDGGVLARPRLYDPSDPNTYPTSSTPATEHTSSSGLASSTSRGQSGSYNYVPEI